MKIFPPKPKSIRSDIQQSHTASKIWSNSAAKLENRNHCQQCNCLVTAVQLFTMRNRTLFSQSKSSCGSSMMYLKRSCPKTVFGYYKLLDNKCGLNSAWFVPPSKEKLRRLETKILFHMLYHITDRAVW